VSIYVMQQSPDGAWFAESDSGDLRHNLASWDAVAALMDVNTTVTWQSLQDLNRFRAQFGEPPPGLDLNGVGVADVSGD
jgi:hypothetical protein